MRKLLAYILSTSFVWLNVFTAALASTSERLPGRRIFCAVTPAFAPASSATDIFYIPGSASATIRVMRIEVTGTQTTAGKVTMNVVKRNTANSGGTSSNITPTPLNGNQKATSITPVYYTANPTTGNTVGTVWSRQTLVPAASSLAATDCQPLFIEDAYGEPIQLNGTSDGIAINLNGVTVTGGSFIVNVEYEEQDI